MPSYLVVISIGPVQGFIASARRTRDLWFGSELLSEIAKAVALDLDSSGAELIFPSPRSKDDLQAGSSFNVGNKLMVLIDNTTSEEIKKLAGEVKSAANQRWKLLAGESLRKIQTHPVKFNVREEVWTKQVNDILEVFVAWTPLQENYGETRKRLEQLLAARKNTRDFKPSAVPEEVAWSLPKSSLDGQRETVLPKTLKRWQRRRMGLSEGEQLDCPALVKRLGGEDHDSRFTPLSRIAIDPWLRGVVNKKIDLGQIKECLNGLVDDGLVTNVLGNEKLYNDLPYDGQLLFPSRIEAERKRLDREKEEGEPTHQTDKAIRRLNLLDDEIKKAGLYTKFGDPLPYLAIIAADGDRMGKLLNNIGDADAHRKVSEKLTLFATSVPAITRKYRGHCIYAGGDDVLALVPLDKAVGFARELRDAFCDKLKAFGGDAPTLSVGIAVGHFLEPMGRLLGLARQAEKLAKGNELPEPAQKDALGIILSPRSGAAIEYRARWGENPDRTLHTWINAHLEDLIPDGVAYELREEARDLRWAREEDVNHPLIAKEVERILGRKKAAHGQKDLSEQMINNLSKHAAKVGMETLAEELILTRRFADAHRQSGEKPDCTTIAKEDS